jgi:LPXTG-motif cell wall-anchored protein
MYMKKNINNKKIIGLALFVFLSALILPSVVSNKGTGISFNSKAKASSFDIQVDALCAGSDCGESTIANSNTTRKLAVSSNGTIYILFRNSNGIWVSKSTNRGVSFSSATNVSTENREAEIGTSANGKVYVVWNSSNSYVISSSSDGALTWETPVVAGQSSGAQAHMAISGDYIYLVGQSGTTLYHSSNGGQTWGTTTVGTSQAFADVHVDPITKHVYVFTDNPTVFWYVSTDNGQTLSARKTTGKSVFFSVGALTSTGTSKYFYMAGSGANLERINLSDESVLTSTVSSSAGSTTRSLTADACGNVVSGHKSGTSLQFQYSTDSGQTFSTAQTVVTSGDRANASINTTNGDVMFLYESAGNIYLSTYSGLFGSGTNCYTASISQTAIEFTAPGQTPSITLNNTSSNPLSVDSISITGSAFTISHTCGTSIAPGGSCVVSINGTNQADETLSIVLGGTRRTIPVSLGSVAALQPVVIPSTTVPSITTPPTTAPEQTSTTSLPPQQTPENPVALSPPVTGSPQPVFTETEKTKVNSGSEIKNTSLPETGIQTVYVLLLSVYIMSLGFFLIIFKKSKQK